MKFIDSTNSILIGSSATYKSLSPTLGRDFDLVIYKKDIDIEELHANGYGLSRETEYLISYEHAGVPLKIEFHLADKQQSLQWLLENYKDLKIATPEILYSLLLGHVHFTKSLKKFLKYINKIYNYQINGVEPIEEFVDLHYKTTEERLGKIKTPKLNKSKEEFFNDKVKKYFEHDDLHKVFAVGEEPMYFKIKKEGNTVMCDKEKWDKLDNFSKAKCIVEEIMVIGAERKLIPTLFGDGVYFNEEEAFMWAYMGVATNLTSGWFRKDSIDLCHIIFDHFRPEVPMECLQKAIMEEKIKPLSEKQIKYAI